MLTHDRKVASELLIVRPEANSVVAQRSPRRTKHACAMIYAICDIYDGKLALEKGGRNCPLVTGIARSSGFGCTYTMAFGAGIRLMNAMQRLFSMSWTVCVIM